MELLVNAAFLLFFFVGFLPFPSAGSPYRYYTFDVTWGEISPTGKPQRGMLINGMFPGPEIRCVTNDNILVNVFNHLDVGLLFTWNGVQQRRNSWQDGVAGTNCRIPPGTNYTFMFQVKDQIGSFFYFPSTDFQRSAGGFGALNIDSRSLVPVPFDPPAADFTVLIGDWYTSDHTYLKKNLDRGKLLKKPDAVLINGGSGPGSKITVEPGKTYRLRITNVGLSSSLNFRIQGHKMKLVEVEGTHTVQNEYESLDIHVGQSYSVLLKTDQEPKDYYIVASTRFNDYALSATTLLHYTTAQRTAQGPLPRAPPGGFDWSINQAKSIRTNLTASAARHNPQGTYHYGKIKIDRSIVLENKQAVLITKSRYAVNSVSFEMGDTPLKLADHFNISGVFTLGSITDRPTGQPPRRGTSVLDAKYKSFVEIVFQNSEHVVQSWHLDGYSFFVVGMGSGSWNESSRTTYNLNDAVSRSTTQVYPKSWTAVLLSADNAGMWNLRSAMWGRQYLGQQLYLRVKSPVHSTRDEYEINPNAIMCGKAKNFKPVPPK